MRETDLSEAKTRYLRALYETTDPSQRPAALHLLGGEIDEAIALAEQAPPVGWSGGDHPGPVVIPYLLRAASGEAEPTPGTALADLWRGIDTEEPLYTTWDLDPEKDVWTDQDEPSSQDSLPKPRPVRLTPFLQNRLQQHAPDPAQRERFLKAAWKVAQRRVKTIVENKHRRANAHSLR